MHKFIHNSELSNEFTTSIFILHHLIGFFCRIYRRAAYRQFTMWARGRLGKGNRQVIPACVVTYVRSVYPEASGRYKGYLDVDDDEDN